MHERSPVSIPLDRGLHTIQNWHNGETVLPFSSYAFQTPNTYRPIVRSDIHETTTSLSDILTTNPAYRWWQESPDDFLKASRTDYDLHLALRGFDDLLTQVVERENTDDAVASLHTEAIAEKLLEICELATPHIPKVVFERIHTLKKGKTKKERSIHIPHFPEIKLPELPSLPDLPRPARRDRAQEPKRDFSIGGSREVTHPLLEQDGITGRERAYKGKKNKGKRFIEFKGKNPHDTFIVTRIENFYDPESGVITTDSEKTPLNKKLRGAHRYDPYITARLGKIRLQDTPYISLPYAVFNTIGLRHVPKNLWTDTTTSDVTIIGADGKNIADKDVISNALESDQVGNLFINVSSLDKEIQQKISEVPITLKVHLSHDHVKNTNSETEWIGPATNNMLTNFSLYPKEIQRLIRTLQKGKYERAKREDLLTNRDIFIRLAQFLGNEWLTYHILDVKHNPDDPIGFRQTERVLDQRQTSCEGANIALGRLMRYFLNDGEEIAYVSGFNLSHSGEEYDTSYATGEDYHLKVLYKDSEGNIDFFDATPWSKKDHSHFDQNKSVYKKTKSEWIRRKAHIREDLSFTKEEEDILIQEAREAQERLDKAWHGYTKEELEEVKSLYRDLFDVSIQPGAKGSIDGIIENPVVKTDPVKGLLSFLRKNNGPLTKYIYGIDKINLLKFLLTNSDVPTHVLPFIEPLTHSSVDGILRLDIRLFTDKLYKPSVARMKPRAYTNLLSSIFREDTSRTQTLQTLEDIQRAGIPATEQNIQVYNTLSSMIEGYATTYSGRLKDIFSQHKEKISTGDIDSFFNDAPFMLLFQHPFNALPPRVIRSMEKETLGYLLPKDDVLTIEELIDQSLSMWKERLDKTLQVVEEKLKTAPLIQNPPPTTIEVPSVRFWKETLQESEDEDDSEKKIFLDPIRTFVHLKEELFGSDV